MPHAVAPRLRRLTRYLERYAPFFLAELISALIVLGAAHVPGDYRNAALVAAAFTATALGALAWALPRGTP